MDHNFFAPTSAGRSLRFCEKKRITRAKPAYRRQDAKAQRRDGRQALREEKRMPAAEDGADLEATSIRSASSA